MNCSILTCKRLVVGCGLLFFILQLLLAYFSTPVKEYAPSHRNRTSPLIHKLNKKEETRLKQLISGRVHSYSYRVIPYSGTFVKGYSENFNFSKKADIIALLHIQKTGGSEFNHKLVLNLNISNCYLLPYSKKHYKCSRSTTGHFPWLVSRLTPNQLNGKRNNME